MAGQSEGTARFGLPERLVPKSELRDSWRRTERRGSVIFAARSIGKIRGVYSRGLVGIPTGSARRKNEETAPFEKSVQRCIRSSAASRRRPRATVDLIF